MNRELRPVAGRAEREPARRTPEDRVSVPSHPAARAPVKHTVRQLRHRPLCSTPRCSMTGPAVNRKRTMLTPITSRIPRSPLMADEPVLTPSRRHLFKTLAALGLGGAVFQRAV